MSFDKRSAEKSAPSDDDPTGTRALFSVIEKWSIKTWQ